ncbi:hypothetical protein O181_005908 [Austropuccinia psidii MF-1]|uniref:Uncharacterized protein n=1 Tax=Austropuccinia psidii MF-1 TaxID=1389203 RepID=A0A9Q3GG12_9BASI|nr:hypothetical protein [Austropuccinia psidii MF-1]
MAPESIVRRGGFLVLNLLLLGPLGSNSETLEKETSLWSAIDSQKIPDDFGAASRRVEELDWKLLLMNPQPLIPPLDTEIVPTLVTRKDERLGTLKRNLVFQDNFDTYAEGSAEMDGEELELTTLIQRRRIHSTSPSPSQGNTTTNEVIRSPQPPQPGHLHLPLPLPIWNHLRPEPLETQFRQSLNQSFTTLAAGISLETLLIKKR